jgi:hypothetical protein
LLQEQNGVRVLFGVKVCRLGAERNELKDIWKEGLQAELTNLKSLSSEEEMKWSTRT